MTVIQNRNQEEQKKELFLMQKQLLDTFLEHGAISREQYDKSLGGLIVKIGVRIVSEIYNRKKKILRGKNELVT